MFRRNILLIFFLFFSFLLYFTPNFIKASGLEENFSGPVDENIWKIYQNGGSILIESDLLKLNSNTSSFPYLYLKNNPFDSFSDFKLEIKFRYLSVEPWGTGISIGNDNPPNNTDINYLIQNDGKIAIFKIWQDSIGGFGIYYHKSITETISQSIKIKGLTANTDNHLFIIIRQNGNYQIVLDGQDIPIPGQTTRIPNTILLGNSQFVGGSINPWNNLEIDYIKINSLSSPPLVLIPGLGASWNTEAMFYGGSGGEWKMTPFVNVYDRFINTAESNGYTINDNLFVWNYDWRKRLADITSDFNNFIDSTPNLKDAEQIDFVGHSLGGLVARTWVQNFDNDPIKKTNKLVTVGSPHNGAVKAYEALAGGRISDKADLGWLGMQLLLQMNKKGFTTDAETIRTMVPILNDITPTFNFIRKGTQLIPATQTSFSNTYLADLNQSVDSSIFSGFIIGNTGRSTTEKLVIQSRSLIDQLLNLWPDGRIKQKILSFGDGTVLKSSAYLAGNETLINEYSSSHSQIVNDSTPISKIFEILDKNNVTVSGPDAYPDNNLLIFYLASPATIKLNGVLTPTNPGLPFIIIPNPSSGNYQIELTGIGNGTYHLYLGLVTPTGNFWQTYEGEIANNEVKNYDFNINPNNPSLDPLVDANGLKQLIRAQGLLTKLNSQFTNQHLTNAAISLNQAINEINSSSYPSATTQIKNALNSLSGFRKTLSDSQVEQYNQAEEVMRIITFAWENILRGQSLTSKANANLEYRNALSYYSLAERVIRLEQRAGKLISVLRIVSVQKSGELLSIIKIELPKNNFTFVEPQSYLARLFASEGL